jgi:hypothetical protein
MGGGAGLEHVAGWQKLGSSTWGATFTRSTPFTTHSSTLHFTDEGVLMCDVMGEILCAFRVNDVVAESMAATPDQVRASIHVLGFKQPCIALSVSNPHSSNHCTTYTPGRFSIGITTSTTPDLDPRSRYSSQPQIPLYILQVPFVKFHAITPYYNGLYFCFIPNSDLATIAQRDPLQHRQQHSR